MSVTTTKFIRKPLFVDAVRITGGNIEEVAAWCQGDVQWEESPGSRGTGKKYIRVRVHNPKNPRQTKAFVGDWLLYTERGYKVYTNKAFYASFDETVQEPIQDDPNITVIGPACFATVDGSVLNWKGTNYVPQEAGTPVYTDSEKPHGYVQGDEEIEIVPATPESITQAVEENEEARAKEEAEASNEPKAA